MYRQRRKSNKGTWIALTAAFATLVIGFCGLRQMDAKIYNKGICKECSGNMEYERTIGHNSYLEYEYICESCGHSIRIETKFK